MSIRAIFIIAVSPSLEKKETKGPAISVFHQIKCQLLLLGEFEL